MIIHKLNINNDDRVISFAISLFKSENTNRRDEDFEQLPNAVQALFCQQAARLITEGYEKKNSK